jgi:hypothetical protein
MDQQAFAYGAWTQPVAAPRKRGRRRKIKIVVMVQKIYARLKPAITRKRPSRK